PSGGAPLVMRAGDDVRIEGRVEVVLEDGTTLAADGALPRDLPLGYHIVRGDDGERRLIVSPGRCHLPAGLRTWGWAVQLYALRSSASWGIGDLADLRTFGEWSHRRVGAGIEIGRASGRGGG